MRFFVGVEHRVRALRRQYAHWIYAGSKFYCPICEGSYRKFKGAGRGKYRRKNAICPKCNGRERDRLMHLFFQARGESLSESSGRVLHIAPEVSLATHLLSFASDCYVCGDLIRTDVDVRFDVQTMPFADQSFDVVYCSHVLQAVCDDVQALREIYRVLKPTGWAIVNVPSRGAKTKEFSAGGDGERPADFVRIYGQDFTDLLAQSGFALEEVHVDDLMSPAEQLRMRVDTDTAGAVYLVRRASIP